MSLIKMIAIEPCDGNRPGDSFDVPERQARQLIARGLAKMAAPPHNKMAQPVANKSSPLPADGEAQQSPASLLAPASPLTTASALAGGVLVKRGPGRPRKNVE